MEDLKKIKHMLRRELEEYSRMSNIPTGSIDTLHKITDIIKNIDKIIMLEEYEDSDESYDVGNSRASRRGRHYVRGHYSRDGRPYETRGDSYNDEESYEGGHSSRRRYSYDDGKEEVHRMLKDAMNSTQDDRQRDVIRRCIDQLERM